MRMREVVTAAAILGMAGPALAGASESEATAQRLVGELAGRKMQYVAAKDPADPGRYVAAMRAGDGLLLVVSARYAQPVLFNERLYRGDHEGAYRELNAAGDRKGKLFVQDLGAPGLHETPAKGDPFDLVYEDVTRGLTLDGDWKAQKLTRDAYRDACRRVDHRYAEALRALVSALAPAPTTAGR